MFDAKAPGSLGLQAWAQDQEEFCCDEAKETWWGEGWKIGAMERFLPSSTNTEKACLVKRNRTVLEAKG